MIVLAAVPPGYDRLPVTLQHAACSIGGAIVRVRRYSGEFSRALAWLVESDRWDVDRLRRYQAARLRGLIERCYADVPYYQRLFRQLRLRPGDFRHIGDLKQLPILTKEIVRRHLDDFVSRRVARGRLRRVSTSGTTGAGLTLLRQASTEAFQWAVWWRLRKRFGLDIADRHLLFGGRRLVPRAQTAPPFWRYNLPLNQTYASVFHLSEANLPHYASHVERGAYIYLSGYPSAISILAEHMARTRRRRPLSLRAVCTGSESLLPAQRQVIEEALGCRVIDTYGLAECVCNMSQCEEGLYHEDMELGIIEREEIERVDGVVVARIIGTGLVDEAVPLLRYDTGDVATFVDGRCACGRTTPTARSIDGRAEGVIETPDGRRIGRLSHLFAELPNIHESQVEQTATDRLVVRLVPRPEYTRADEDRYEQRLREIVGGEMMITFEMVTAIPREKNGKLRAVISRL